MCGIAGYKTTRSIPPDVLDVMMAALHHRGPDAAGVYRSTDYVGGMRRLSINDLATGDQPLYNEDRSVVLLYNGEIYNSPALRRELEAKGYRFRTRSDGEVIAHLWAEHGEKLFERLDGMFACALWIEREKKLVLARDIPGEKPLYFTRLSDTDVAFASELKSLVEFPGVDRSLDAQAIWDFPTFLWVPEPRTAYRAIEALPRSHYLVADASGIRLVRYENRFNTAPIDLGDAAVVRETRRVVTEAVESRLLSDVPVGCFLSSGLDSSIVTTLASRALPDLTTFTIGFEDVEDPYHGRANESEYAAAYAKRLGTRHRTIQVTADDFRRSLVDFCKYGDQPFGVSSGLGILAIAQAARQENIKVLLSGDGADECFGGYSWYVHLDRFDAQQTTGDRNADTTFQSTTDTEAKIAVLAKYAPQERAFALHYYASERDKRRLYNPEYFETARARSSVRWFDEYLPDAPWTARDYIAQDRAFYFPQEMLRKVDRMTMAHSVEGRVPFAAPAVLSHADKLSYRHMVRGSTLKWALREAFADALPSEVVTRPKHGFNVPIDHWLRTSWSDLVDETFAAGSAVRRLGIVREDAGDVARAMLGDERKLHGHTILCFIMLNLWLTREHGNHR
jgi:asparagine synthase (glutamine-hydrolysing)